MPSMIPAGPFATLATASGAPFPYYIVPFDKDGRCEAPLTRRHLLDHLADGYSDIFLFSHGWNNDWTAASRRYEHFIEGFQAQQKQLGLASPAGYRPLLVGIFWPSQALAWFDSESGPDFAASDPGRRTADIEIARQQLNDIARMLPGQQRERFFELAQADALSAGDSRELAQMLVALTAPDDEGAARGPATADDLLAAAASLDEEEPDYDAVGTVTGAAAGGPAAAGDGGVLKKLDPRNLLKPFTVWQMKDRAGTVGATGVADLLRELLQRSDARIHVLGHSFGCKVVMSAVAALPDGLRPLHSALLLQPAVSQYAFAAEVPGRPGVAGGYRGNLARIRGPVIATFSAHDAALTRSFHLALRRKSDLGEQPQHAGGPPSEYGALGGFGPQRSGETILDIKDPGLGYDLSPGGRIIGVQGSRTIKGHGDISNPSTWWLAHSAASATLP